MEVNLLGALTIYKQMSIKPNFSALSREYKKDRKTIRKYYEGVESKERSKKKNEFDEYVEIIKERLSIPGIRIKSVYWYLSNEYHVKTSYSNFKQYVRNNHLNEKVVKEAHVYFETDPGEQLQVDWVDDIKLETVNGDIIQFNLFSATLGYSRFHYFEYVESSTELDFKKCLINCFKAIGGKPQHILTDNMSAIVNISNGKRIKHPSILQFEKDIEVPILLCDVRHPMTKGKDETSNKYANWLLSYSKKIRDKHHLLNVIKKFNVDINKQVNTRTNMPPIMVFEKEKEYLKPLGNLDFLSKLEENMNSCIVPETLLINFNGDKYSVPKEYIGKNVKFVNSNNILYIYYNKCLIAQHQIINKKINYDIHHYAEALASRGMTQDKIEDYVKKNMERFK